MPDHKDIVVSDDCGLLSLVDHRAYRSFVSADWTYEQLLSHFNDEMAELHLLVWECGDGGDEYLVRVRRGITSERGYRETVGGIKVSSDALLVSSYDALTMAAQFEDETLPPKHEEHQMLAVTSGDYRVRIVQMYDPAKANALAGSPHFLIEIEPGAHEPWSSAAWLSA